MSLEISLIDTEAGLTSLREEWRELLQDSMAASICLTWEWASVWWQVYGRSEGIPHILCVHDGPRLVGIAPFYIQHAFKYRVLPVRVLRFIGTGENEQDEVASEYQDIIARKGMEKSVVQLVWSYLTAKSGADQYFFNDVLPESLVASMWAKSGEAGCATYERLVGIRYSIELPGSWEAYLGLLDGGAAKRIPYKKRKFERAGRVELRVVDRVEDLAVAFDELVRLHNVRWTARGKPGVFSSPRFLDFHRSLARLLLPLGMLRFRFLDLDGVPVAALYNFQHCGTEYFYQGGFDSDRMARFSPGMLAHVYAIDDAIRTGTVRYDFMKGGTDSYKTEFGCGEHVMRDLVAIETTNAGRLLAVESWAKKRLRPVRALFR
jgi:CelD/BcsL family acetyltransferase involved in cellulose biosynthesis